MRITYEPTITRHGVLTCIHTCKNTVLFQLKNELKPRYLLSPISAILHGTMVKYLESWLRGTGIKLLHFKMCNLLWM